MRGSGGLLYRHFSTMYLFRVVLSHTGKAFPAGPPYREVVLACEILLGFAVITVKDSRQNHRIVPNGYNLGMNPTFYPCGPNSHRIGRDYLVTRATSGGSWKGRSWIAQVEWRTDLLDKGSDGENILECNKSI